MSDVATNRSESIQSDRRTFDKDAIHICLVVFVNGQVISAVNYLRMSFVCIPNGRDTILGRVDRSTIFAVQIKCRKLFIRQKAMERVVGEVGFGIILDIGCRLSVDQNFFTIIVCVIIIDIDRDDIAVFSIQGDVVSRGVGPIKCRCCILQTHIGIPALELRCCGITGLLIIVFDQRIADRDLIKWSKAFPSLRIVVINLILEEVVISQFFLIDPFFIKGKVLSDYITIFYCFFVFFVVCIVAARHLVIVPDIGSALPEFITFLEINCFRG